MPLFEESRPLSYEEGIKVLQANQKKFATARANDEYEKAWAKFIEEREPIPFNKGKAYGTFEDIANDVYNFYVQHIGTENLPRVRFNYTTDLEGIVCEIPVNGLKIVSITGNYENAIVTDKFVVIHYNNGVNNFFFDRNKKMNDFFVIQ